MTIILNIRAFVWNAADWFRRTAIKVNKVPILTASFSAFLWGVASILQEIGGALGSFASDWQKGIDVIKNVFTKSEVTQLTEYTKQILLQDIDTIRQRLGMTEAQFREYLLPKLDSFESRFDLLDLTVKEEVAKLGLEASLTKQELDYLKENTDSYTRLLADRIRLLEDKAKQQPTWFEQAKLFFTDPAQFTFNLVEEIIERFW